MEKILNQDHDKNIFFFALSNLFERASYYGTRSLIVLYMIGETLKMSSEEALGIYGWISVSLLISGVLGAIIGDLLLGNKTTLIIGAILQMLGAFVLSSPSLYTLYIGLGLIVVGGGFYKPNLKANFGKLYLDKTKLLTSAFMILYIAIDMGAFIGVLVIGYTGEAFNFSVGFILAGVFMALALIFSVFTHEIINLRGLKIIAITTTQYVKLVLVFILFGLFWIIYEFGSNNIFEINRKLVEISGINISSQLLTSLNFFFMIPIGFVLIVIWSKYYSKSMLNLCIGFFAASVGYGLLYLIPESSASLHFGYYIISVGFMAFAELFVSPVIDTIITKYSNPKYLAIVMSLIMLPYRAFYFISAFLQENFISLSQNVFAICAIVMVLISMGLVLFTIVDKENEKGDNLDYYHSETLE